MVWKNPIMLPKSKTSDKVLIDMVNPHSKYTEIVFCIRIKYALADKPFELQLNAID